MEAYEKDRRLLLDTETADIKGRADGAVTITRGGADMGAVSVGLDGRFLHTVPLEVGLNEFAVTDSHGTVTVSLIRLITDRSQEDMNYLTALLETPMEEWPGGPVAGQAIAGLAVVGYGALEWFNRAILLGSYDYTDFNRVTLAMLYLKDHLTQLGYLVKYKRTTWQEEEGVHVTPAAGYLADVVYFRGLLESDAPEAPADMEGLTIQDANSIESILIAIDAALGLTRRFPWYSGEIISGEV